MLTIPLKPIALAIVAAAHTTGSVVTLAAIAAMVGCAILTPVCLPLGYLGLGIGAVWTALFVITFTAHAILLSPV